MGGGVSTHLDITNHLCVVARNPSGVLGIGLNDQNMVTMPGPAGTLAGLRVWDKIIKIDNIVVGSKTLVATMSGMKPMPTHTLTVLRKADLAGRGLKPSQPVPEPEPVPATPSAGTPAAASPAKPKGITAAIKNAAAGKLTSGKRAVSPLSAAPAAATQSPAKPDGIVANDAGIIAAMMIAAADTLNTRVSRAPTSSPPMVARGPLAPVALLAPVPRMVPFAPLPPIVAVA